MTFCNQSQFLEKAKQNVNETKVRSSSVHVHPEEYGKTGIEKVKKEKKSWKSGVISWWKGNKKSKHLGEPTNNNSICESNVCEPIYSCGKGPDLRYRRPTSGPLTSLFRSSKSEIPYVSLHQQNFPSATHNNYGPPYGVT